MSRVKQLAVRIFRKQLCVISQMYLKHNPLTVNTAEVCNELRQLREKEARRDDTNLSDRRHITDTWPHIQLWKSQNHNFNNSPGTLDPYFI